jgi:hypothetical protein
MDTTIDQRLKQYELLIQNISNKKFQAKGERLLQNTQQLYLASKIISSKEYENDSSLYAEKVQMNQIYFKHLKMIKPLLNRHLKFWKRLEESEQTAKGFSGWLQHMRTFYFLLIHDKRYRKVFIRKTIQLKDLKIGFMTIRKIQKIYRKKKEYAAEKRSLHLKLQSSLKDLEAWHALQSN